MPQHFTSVGNPVLATIIANGGVGVLPTDTVYGLVAKAASELAITKMYSLKQRKLQPGTLIAASTDDLIALGFPETQVQKAAPYWPASLSVVLDATAIPDYLKRDRTSLAVRIPNDASLLNLLQKTGPLMTTSANAPKQPTATTIQAAFDYFGNALDFYVDAGDLGVRPPSTIIGFHPDGTFELYREGAVPAASLQIPQ